MLSLISHELTGLQLAGFEDFFRFPSNKGHFAKPFSEKWLNMIPCDPTNMMIFSDFPQQSVQLPGGSGMIFVWLQALDGGVLVVVAGGNVSWRCSMDGHWVHMGGIGG